MTKPTIRIHDVTTNEVIDREMTDLEYEIYQAEKAKDVVDAQIAADKLAAKEAALNKLGLTADEIAALFG